MTPRHETLSDYQRRLNEVINYLWYHLDEECDLATLAGIACFSPFHFHRIFRALVGEPVGAYVSRLKLERAAYELVTRNRSVTDIGLDAGFESPAAFSRAFSRQFGRSPSQFSKRGKAALEELRYPPRIELTTNEEDEMEGVKIAELEPMTIAYTHSPKGYFQEGIDEAWRKLLPYYSTRHPKKVEEACLGLSWDNPVVIEVDRCRYEAAMAVDEGTKPEGEVGVRRLPGGTYAQYRYVGPYSGLSETFDRLIKVWLAGSGYTMRDEPCLEFYRSDPGKTPPAELVTDIYLPVEKVS
ncbi:MAG: AraC family transcriptional regulator [bacterium]|nr:AraC family transcriptional regulator [bacterium]